MRCSSALAVLSLLFAAGCAGTPAAPDDDARAAPSGAAAELLEAGNLAAGDAMPPVTSFEAGVRAGDEAWRRNQLDVAVYMYVQALAFNDRDGETLAKIGAIHELRGNAPLARKAFELAAERSPGDARIAERLGLLCLRLGDDAAAQRALENALAIAPDRWQVHEGLGILALRGRDATAALRHFDAALALEPRSPLALAGRGRAHTIAGNLDVAEVDLEAALAAGEGEWQKGVRSDLGTLYARRGRYADGLAMLLEVMPEAQAYNRLGEIAMSRQDYAGAERLLMKALEASPTFYAAADRNLIVVREHLSSARPRAGAAPRQEDDRASHFAQGSVVVRTHADAESEALGYLQPRDPVDVVREDGDWTLVRFTHRASGDLRQGWVRRRYLGPTL